MGNRAQKREKVKVATKAAAKAREPEHSTEVSTLKERLRQLTVDMEKVSQENEALKSARTTDARGGQAANPAAKPPEAKAAEKPAEPDSVNKDKPKDNAVTPKEEAQG